MSEIANYYAHDEDDEEYIDLVVDGDTVSDHETVPVIEGVTHLTFGHHINRNLIDMVLENITHLTFDYSFNQSLIGVALPNLTHLILGAYFNQSLVGMTLPNVTHLTFGYYFNQSLVSVDLPHLMDITFGICFSEDLSDEFLIGKNAHFTKKYYKRKHIKRIEYNFIISTKLKIYNDSCPICME